MLYISIILVTWRGGRTYVCTYVRTVDDVMAFKPRFLAWMGWMHVPLLYCIFLLIPCLPIHCKMNEACSSPTSLNLLKNPVEVLLEFLCLMPPNSSQVLDCGANVLFAHSVCQTAQKSDISTHFGLLSSNQILISCCVYKTRTTRNISAPR